MILTVASASLQGVLERLSWTCEVRRGFPVSLRDLRLSDQESAGPFRRFGSCFRESLRVFPVCSGTCEVRSARVSAAFREVATSARFREFLRVFPVSFRGPARSDQGASEPFPGGCDGRTSRSGVPERLSCPFSGTFEVRSGSQ